MKILGIDPGLRKTGWGLIDFKNNFMNHIADGFISPPVEDNDGDRLLFIFNEVEDIVLKYKPSVIGIEKTFVGEGNISSLKLGMARGICILVAAKAKIEIKELAPKLIKKTVTGSGIASKFQVTKMVKNLLGVIPKNEDSADALAVAISTNSFSNVKKIQGVNLKDNNLNKAIKNALLKEKNKR